MPSTSQEISAEMNRDVAKGLETLRKLRDEIKLHIHLAGMDAKDRWGSLESEFKQLEGAAHETGDSVKNLVGKLVHGFEELRNSLGDTKH